MAVPQNLRKLGINLPQDPAIKPGVVWYKLLNPELQHISRSLNSRVIWFTQNFRIARDT